MKNHLKIRVPLFLSSATMPNNFILELNASGSSPVVIKHLKKRS